ncbi:hypothetical protein Ddc_07426 [Ditylenchus destructor]|nr:hypothetical protein Ddc_07426 [Ditylenchus destructor]
MASPPSSALDVARIDGSGFRPFSTISVNELQSPEPNIPVIAPAISSPVNTDSSLSTANSTDSANEEQLHETVMSSNDANKETMTSPLVTDKVSQSPSDTEKKDKSPPIPVDKQTSPTSKLETSPSNSQSPSDHPKDHSLNAESPSSPAEDKTLSRDLKFESQIMDYIAKRGIEFVILMPLVYAPPVMTSTTTNRSRTERIRIAVTSIFTRRHTTPVKIENFEHSAYHSCLESSDETGLPLLYEAGFKKLKQLQIKMERNTTEIQEAMKIQDIKERDAKLWPLLKQSANLLEEFNETQAGMEKKLKAHDAAKNGFDKTVADINDHIGANAVRAAKVHYDLLPTMFKAKTGAVDLLLSGTSKDVSTEKNSDLLKNVVELENHLQAGIDACNKAMEHYKPINPKPPGYDDIPNYLKNLQDQKKKTHMRRLLLDAHIESEAIKNEYSEELLERGLVDAVAKLVRAVGKDIKEVNALDSAMAALGNLRVSISNNLAKLKLHVKTIQDAINGAEAEMKEKAPDHTGNDPKPILEVLEKGKENLKNANTKYTEINPGELKQATFKKLSDKFVEQQGKIANELKNLDALATKLFAMQKVYAAIHNLAVETKEKLEKIEVFEKQIMETDHVNATNKDLHDRLAQHEKPAEQHLEGATQNGIKLKNTIEKVVNPFEKTFGDDQTIKDAVKRLQGEQERLENNAKASKQALTNHQGMAKLAKLRTELETHRKKFQDLYDELLKIEEGKFPEVPAAKLKELLDAYAVLKTAIGDYAIVDTHTKLMDNHKSLPKHQEHASLHHALTEIGPKIKLLAEVVRRHELALPDVEKLQKIIENARDLKHSVDEFRQKAVTMEEDFDKLESHLDDETKGALKEEQLKLLADLVERAGIVERDVEKKKKSIDDLNVPSLAAENKSDANLMAQHTAADTLLGKIKTEIADIMKRLDGSIKLHKAQHQMIKMFHFYRDRMANLTSVIEADKKKADEVLALHHDWDLAKAHNSLIPDLLKKLGETKETIHEIQSKIEKYVVPEQSHDHNKGKIHVEKKNKLIEQLKQYAKSIDDKVTNLNKHLEAANTEDQIRARLKSVSDNMEITSTNATKLWNRMQAKMKNGSKPGEVHEEVHKHNNEHAEEINKMRSEIDAVLKQFGGLSKESKLHKQYEILIIKARFDRVLSQHHLNVATIEELRRIIVAEEETRKLQKELANLKEALGTKDGSLGKAIDTLQNVTIPEIEKRFAGVDIKPRDNDDLPHPDDYIASGQIAKACEPVDEEYNRVMDELAKHISTTDKDLHTTPYYNVRMAQNLNKVTNDLHKEVHPLKESIVKDLKEFEASLKTRKECFDQKRKTGYDNAKNIETIMKLREIVKNRRDEWMPDTVQQIREKNIGTDDSVLLKLYNCKKDFMTSQEWYTKYVQRYKTELGNSKVTVEQLEEEGSDGSFLAKLQKEKKEEVDQITTLMKQYEELEAHLKNFEETMEKRIKAIEAYLEATKIYATTEWSDEWFEKKKQDLFEQKPITDYIGHYKAVMELIKNTKAEKGKMDKALEELSGKTKSQDKSKLLYHKQRIGDQCKEIHDKKAAYIHSILVGAHDLSGIILPKAISDLLIPATRNILTHYFAAKLDENFHEISKFKTDIEETHGTGKNGVFTQISDAFKRRVKEIAAARKQAENSSGRIPVPTEDITLNRDELRKYKPLLKKMVKKVDEIYEEAKQVVKDASSHNKKHTSSEHDEDPFKISFEDVESRYQQVKFDITVVRVAIETYLYPDIKFWELNKELDPVLIKYRVVSRGITTQRTSENLIGNANGLPFFKH